LALCLHYESYLGAWQVESADESAHSKFCTDAHPDGRATV